MTRRGATILVVTMVVIALGALSVFPSIAQETPPPIAVELLTSRAEFTDDVDLQVKSKMDGTATQVLNSSDPSRTVVARITVQPGAQFPWHTHPGPVLVNVAQGELVYVQAADCVERSYPVGTAFVDPGRGNVHTAFNPTNGVTVLVATFFEIEPGGPLTINAEAPDSCQIEVGEHSH
jgi:predicted metal-dependent enzyme (double-stranded beta helix superfamily)